MHNIFLFPDEVNSRIHVQKNENNKIWRPNHLCPIFLYQHHFKLTPIYPSGIQWLHTMLYFRLHYLE